MKLSAQQTTALDRVSAWSRSGVEPWFYLAGYAGTGKTTIAKRIAEEHAGNVMFAAYTGKAASVMRTKGCADASTIHQLIYLPKEKSRAKLRALKKELERTTSEMEKERLRDLIRRETVSLKSPSFEVRPDAPASRASLIIVDECSMVGKHIAEDLLSFGVPILVLGDPAQLPPVKSAGFFTGRKPDFLLTEVHRQARESGILRLATDIREGKPTDFGAYGDDARIVRKGEMEPSEYLEFEQLIVGKNATRRGTNRRVRELLYGVDCSVMPRIGDKLICLRNYHDLGLLNGSMCKALDVYVDGTSDIVSMTVEVDDGSMLSVDTHACIYRGEDVNYFDCNPSIQEMDYGFAITAHKAQGSEFGSVVVFDQSHVFGSDAKRWLYTAVTRASERLVVVR